MGLATDYAVASGADGISMIAVFLLGIFCFILVRIRNDPLREHFTELKFAIPTYFVSLLGLTVYNIIVTLAANGYDPSVETADNMGYFGTVIGLVGDVEIMVCIVGLSLSFFRAMGRPFDAEERFRVATAAVAILLLVLASAYRSPDQRHITSVLSDTYESPGVSASTIIRPYVSWSIIHFLLALGLEGLSLMVFSSSLKARQYTKLTRRLLVITTLNNLRTSYDLYLSISSLSESIPDYTIILTPILYRWTTVVMLSLLTDIGCRKHDGLWSNLNFGPWNSGNAGPNSQDWSECQQQPLPAYGQSQQPGSSNPDQQPTQAGVHASNVPMRGELAASPSQGYQQMYMQQQPQPYLAGQQPPYPSISQSAPVEAHGQPISPLGPVPGDLTAQQQQHPPGQPGVQHVHEVAGIREQKG